MARYSLWVDSFNHVYDYEMIFSKLPKKERDKIDVQNNFTMCHRLKFNVSGSLRETFTLAEIDSLTAGYESEEKLLTLLGKKEYQENYHVNLNNHLIATYKANGTLKEAPLVFNSKLLQKYAIWERKKTKEKRDSRIPLPDTDELKQFCSELLDMATSEETRKYFKNPSLISGELAKGEVGKFRKYLPEGNFYYKKDGSFYKYKSHTLKDAIAIYVRIYDIRMRKISHDEYSVNNDVEYEMAMNDVYQNLRKDYNHLRNAVLLVQLIKKIIDRKNFQQKSVDQQIEFVSDSDNNLHILDPETRKNYIEFLKIERENADLLKQFAEESRKKFIEKYGDGTSEEDDFGISDIEMELGEYDFEERGSSKK